MLVKYSRNLIISSTCLSCKRVNGGTTLTREMVGGNHAKLEIVLGSELQAINSHNTRVVDEGFTKRCQLIEVEQEVFRITLVSTMKLIDECMFILCRCHRWVDGTLMSMPTLHISLGLHYKVVYRGQTLTRLAKCGFEISKESELIPKEWRGTVSTTR